MALPWRLQAPGPGAQAAEVAKGHGREDGVSVISRVRAGQGCGGEGPRAGEQAQQGLGKGRAQVTSG